MKEEYVEETIVEDYEEEESINLNLNSIDCEVLKNKLEKKEGNSAEVDKLAGDIKRKERKINKLLKENEDLDVEMNEEAEKIKERYSFATGYDWHIDVGDCTAAGTKKE